MGCELCPRAARALDTITGPGWLAVGDAAMSFDPLSLRGVTWALESGLAAARAHDASLQGDPVPTSDFGASRLGLQVLPQGA